MATDSWALAVDEQEAAVKSVLSKPVPLPRKQMKRRKRTELPNPYSTS
ncbi:DDX19A isoform 11 [Pan troglodytes]|uniref:DDX19A isoform 11 n=1 Tax=Pan troglodytes TaxID=9598 RepID=A0A2J8KAC3_PANTR|nr:DDX19A isoform 11 [Pan troglodytes]